jgi:hypothetical protein
LNLQTEHKNQAHNHIQQAQFHFITLQLVQQQSGALSASVNAALMHQWLSYDKCDFT